MQQTPLQTNNFTQADILVDNCLYWKIGRGSAQKEELVSRESQCSLATVGCGSSTDSCWRGSLAFAKRAHLE